jgi:hypothetical protein
MEDSQARQYQEMESILRHIARRDSRYLSLWLQWAPARPNSAFRDEVVMLNHTAVPANQLAALAKELLESTDGSELQEEIAQVLLEAAHTAQSVAGKREKDVIVQNPLMLLPCWQVTIILRVTQAQLGNVTVTRAIVQAGKLLDADVVDHIVCRLSRWVSLKEKGLGF